MTITEKIKRCLTPDPQQRQVWDSRAEFLLSCIAMCVGLGNVWRFPFTAYENGGGAFLIPYLIVLVLIGKPLLFLEMGLGQFASRGSVKIWNMAPFFKGVGYASAFSLWCVTSYYCMIMAVTALYFFLSLMPELPWTKCNHDWKNVECGNHTALYDDGTANGTEKSFSQLYFSIEVLHQKSNIHDGIGVPDLHLTLCLGLSWLIIFISLVEGPKSVGKMAYFTASVPYLILVVLLIRGLVLPGAWDGIKLLFTPDWNKILEPKVWYQAVTQCFVTLSVAFGPSIMCASYNPFRHNLYQDAVIITTVDTLVSVLAACTVFSILGNVRHELSEDTGRVLEFSEVVKSGPELIFVVYPQAIAKFEYCPRLFAILLFLMLFTMGIASATYNAGTIFRIIHDRRPGMSPFVLSAGITIAGFLCGVIYTTPGGFLLIDLVDKYGMEFITFIVGVIEVVAISWVYGLSNICRDFEFMLSTTFSCYWKICWGVIAPVSLLVILVYNLYSFTPLDSERYPPIARACGWSLAAMGLSIFPISAIHAVCRTKASTLAEKIRLSWKPAEAWGPDSSEEKEKWLALPKPPSLSRQIRVHLCPRKRKRSVGVERNLEENHLKVPYKEDDDYCRGVNRRGPNRVQFELGLEFA